MSNSLQTSFNIVMMDWHDNNHPQGHLQGQPQDNSNARFLTIKRNMHTCVIYAYITEYLTFSLGICT